MNHSEPLSEVATVLVFALIAITNLCIGYALAVWLGQGPKPWYALLLPGKKTTGLIEIAPLEESDPPPKRQQTEEEEHVVVSLMEISTEDLAKKTPPPKPRPVAEPAAEDEDETFATEIATDFATDLNAKDVADKSPEPAEEPINEDAIDSMSFDQLLDQTKPVAATVAVADEDDSEDETLAGGEIDALLAESGKR